MVEEELQTKKNGYVIKKIRDFFAVIRSIFGDKRIVIISNNKILSIPISSRFQKICVLLSFVLMVWVSYSTTKYVTYEDLIVQKDRQIWTTNVMNENLQYKVSNLHQNLKELSKYFDTIKIYDQLQKKVHLQDQEGKDDYNALLSSESQEQSYLPPKAILMNIRDKVLERIVSLESIITMTGLKVEYVTEGSEVVGYHQQESVGEADKNIGGPYISADISDLTQEEFQMQVDYLIYLENVLKSFPLSKPMKEYWISSGFGKRIDPVRKRVAMHAGIDLVGGYKSEIYSTAPGKVIKAQRYGSYGQYVEIDHGFGLTTRYGHVSKIFVKKGDTVEPGQLIALQGSTGRSTGPHLHYEVRYKGRSIDPAKFLNAGNYVY